MSDIVYTINDFITESNIFEYSIESFEIQKGIMELELLEKCIDRSLFLMENQQFIECTNINIKSYTESTNNDLDNLYNIYTEKTDNLFSKIKKFFSELWKKFINAMRKLFGKCNALKYPSLIEAFNNHEFTNAEIQKIIDIIDKDAYSILNGTIVAFGKEERLDFKLKFKEEPKPEFFTQNMHYNFKDHDNKNLNYLIYQLFYENKCQIFFHKYLGTARLKFIDGETLLEAIDILSNNLVEVTKKMDNENVNKYTHKLSDLYNRLQAAEKSIMQYAAIPIRFNKIDLSTQIDKLSKFDYNQLDISAIKDSPIMSNYLNIFYKLASYLQGILGNVINVYTKYVTFKTAVVNHIENAFSINKK